jgi:hypothetical protein
MKVKVVGRLQGGKEEIGDCKSQCKGMNCDMLAAERKTWHVRCDWRPHLWDGKCTPSQKVEGPGAESDDSSLQEE